MSTGNIKKIIFLGSEVRLVRGADNLAALCIRMRWAGNVARMGEKSNSYKLLMGKPEGRRPLARPKRKWVHNIRMDLVEVGWGDVDWIGLIQDRDRWRAVVNSVLNLRVP
jgi:hypothetical protein